MVEPGVPIASYYVQDHLGNTRVVYKPLFCGEELLSYDVEYVGDYFPYGKIIREYIKSKKEKFLTTEHERDIETGLDYRGARFYDADIGRFLSLDPLAAEYPAWSAYNYVLGNPVAFVDPDGKAPRPPQFTLQALQKKAYQYKKIQRLHIRLNPRENNWQLKIHEKTSVTRTYVKGRGGQIHINSNQSLEKGVASLAWELTNAINADNRKSLDEKVMNGKITKTEFVKGINLQEGEAMANSMAVWKEMGNKLESHGGYGSIGIALYEGYEKGKISRKTLISSLGELQYLFGKIDTDDGQGARPAKEVYGEQYDKLKEEGVKKKFKP